MVVEVRGEPAAVRGSPRSRSSNSDHFLTKHVCMFNSEVPLKRSASHQNDDEHNPTCADISCTPDNSMLNPRLYCAKSHHHLRLPFLFSSEERFQVRSCLPIGPIVTLIWGLHAPVGGRRCQRTVPVGYLGVGTLVSTLLPPRSSPRLTSSQPFD